MKYGDPVYSFSYFVWEVAQCFEDVQGWRPEARKRGRLESGFSKSTITQFRFSSVGSLEKLEGMKKTLYH